MTGNAAGRRTDEREGGPARAAGPVLATDGSAFAERLAAAARAVEDGLERLLGEDLAPGEIARPRRLLDAMRHSVLGGGKRLRPFLTLETARMLGGDAARGLRAGLSVELVHCYSLVHDDLPAMDDDHLRRGRPTVHRAFDEATAILAGDCLLALAFDVACDEATHPDGGVRASLALGLARASGLGGMAGGQMLDLAAEGRFGDGVPLALPEGDIRRLQAMKTGALLAYAVEAGAIVAGADAGARAALGRYGRALGAAFQVADDVLDVVSDAATLGKAAGKDAGAGKGTLVSVLGLEGAKAERDRLAERAVAALEGFGPAADTLREAARFAAGRSV